MNVIVSMINFLVRKYFEIFHLLYEKFYLYVSDALIIRGSSKIRKQIILLNFRNNYLTEKVFNFLLCVTIVLRSLQYLDVECSNVIRHCVMNL